MELNDNVLNNDERNIYKLRQLYSKYGYTQYKMAKFEEYDLYSRNKDFLVSDRVITFTDTNGKLLALKPDVTLSIIKNCDDDETLVQKLCYNENVYRVSKGSNSFREIMQVGLECIGDVDEYNINEVLILASKSLETISSEYVLDISSLDLLSACVDKISSSKEDKAEILKFAEEKSIHEIQRYMESNNMDLSLMEPLKKLLSISSSTDEAMEKIKEIALQVNAEDAYYNLKYSIKGMNENNVRIDFSVIPDTSYYNGIVFQGYIKGIPGKVLSGGQYDNLMKKLKKKSKAIGFAVYLDMLDYMDKDESYDVDIAVVYDDVIEAKKFVNEKINEGLRVYASRKMNKKIRAEKTIYIRNGQVNE